MKFVKLTLSSNGLPTYINTETICQIYEDTTKEGNTCTRIEFSNDYTKVSEPMKVVISKITKEENKKPESEFTTKVSENLLELIKILSEYSPVPEHEIFTLICMTMDILTDDDLPVDNDLLTTRMDMAEKIYKEWPHSVDYYKREENKE